MTSKSDIRLTSTADVVALRIFALLLFTTLCCGGVFGQDLQNETPQAPAIEIEAPASNNAEITPANDCMELVLWFMGSKQAAPVSDNVAPSTIGKKRFINSGMKPNRTLLKSFMKKAVNYDNTIA